VEGKVEVGMPATNDKQLLKPGQQARAKRGEAALALINNVDLEEVTGWRSDKFVFQGEGATIQDIMKQLQRYYDIEVEYQGRIPDDHFVASMPRSLPISRILEVLQKTERIKFRIDDRKVIVMP
jgi:ferric-dicitrate binding protein FerR (iron transport regulator)